MFQLAAIYNVCFGDGLEVKSDIIDGLVNDGVILKAKSGKLSLPKSYQNIAAEIRSIKNVDWIEALRECAVKYNGIITRRTYMEFLPKGISSDKVSYNLSKMEVMGILKKEGVRKATKYHVVKLPELFEM